MSTYRHFIYADLLFNCLSLAEEDSRQILRINSLEPFTFPDDYKDKRLAGRKFPTFSTSISVNGQLFASSQFSGLYFQGIRTIPTEASKLIAVDYLSKRYDLEGVPGFYLSGNRWRLNLYGRGTLRPYRNEVGNIIGLFIYRSFYDPTPGLLSSEGFYKGTPAIQPLEYEERELTYQ